MTYISILPFDLQHLLKYYENYDHWQLLDLICTYGFSYKYSEIHFNFRGVRGAKQTIDRYEIRLSNEKIKYTAIDIPVTEKIYKRTVELDLNQVIHKKVTENVLAGVILSVREEDNPIMEHINELLCKLQYKGRFKQGAPMALYMVGNHTSWGYHTV
jgi:hypothetical protein